MSPATQAPSDSSIPFLLVTSARLMRDRLESALRAASLDLTPGEARTLSMADRLGAVRQAELAAALGIEPMSLVNHLDRLEQRGLIERRPDPSDRRGKLTTLTEKAKPELRKIRQIFEEARRSAMCSFSAHDLATLQSLLQRLCQDLMQGE